MFLIKVYSKWKPFFWTIIIGIAGQFFFMARGIENIPFFLYSMYSHAHQAGDSLKVILIKTPVGYLNPHVLSGRESEMLINNVTYYTQLKKSGYNDDITPTVERRFKNRLPLNTYNYILQGLVNDSIGFSKYTTWWQRYFTSVYKNSWDSVSVVSSNIKYQPMFSKSAVDSIIFTCYFK